MQKEELLRKFNEAFSVNDVEFIIACITDDITWYMVGDKKIEGKEAVADALNNMKSEHTYTLEIQNVITHGDTAAVNGKIYFKENSGVMKTYAFCDVYIFSGFKHQKIKKLTSYVLEDNLE